MEDHKKIKMLEKVLGNLAEKNKDIREAMKHAGML
jgi:hypothetical protein